MQGIVDARARFVVQCVLGATACSALILLPAGCNTWRKKLGTTVETGKLVPISIIPEEGRQKTQDFRVKSDLSFKVRISHSLGNLNAGFNFPVNRTGATYTFSYKVTFYDEKKKEMFALSYSSSQLPMGPVKPRSLFDSPSMPNVQCSADDVKRIAYMKIDYQEHRKGP